MKKLWESTKTIISTYLVQYMLLIIGIIGYIALTKDTDILTNEEKIYNFTIIGIAISIIPITIYLLKKHPIKKTKINFKTISLMIILGLSTSLFYNMLTINFQQENKLLNTNIILLISYVVILAPIFEEILFRYISLNVAKRYYKERTAIIIISIAFALLHSELFNMLYAFLLGIILSNIYIKYKNILYPITLHISANLMSIFITKFNLLALIISALTIILTNIFLNKTK